uniref:Aminotransferase-like plant mobile domain-containing protein n=1 Tax=Oryza rufipogon TaxID=4529 RepID=A0A0E0NYI0_ORYRU
MYEVILHLSPHQKEAIEDSGLGNLLKINKIHIDRNLCNEITRSYDKEKKAFNINGTFVTMTLDDIDCLLGLPSKGDEIFEAPKINNHELFNLYKKEGQTIITLQALWEAIINSSSYDDHFIRRFIIFSIGSFICPTTQRYVRSEYLNLVDDIDKMRELNWSSLTLNQLLKCILKFREKKTNIEGNVCLLQVVDNISGTIDCNEIPDEKEQDKDLKTLHSITSTEQSADITLQESFTKDFWPRMRSLILDCMENDSKCPDQKDTTHVFEDVEQEQIDPRELISNHHEEAYINQNVNMVCETKCNQSRKRLTGPTGRTCKPTNRTDFIYETRDKKDIVRTQTQTKKTIAQTNKEAIMPDTDELRGEKKRKQNNQTPNEISEYKKVPMANLNSYHLATWADSAKTRNPTGPGSSHENMWLHVPHVSVTGEKASSSCSITRPGRALAMAGPAAPARRRRRRSSATAHGGCGKQRRRQRRSRPTRWRSTELRDCVEMAHGDERRTPELRWREKRRHERERGLSLGALPAAAAREGDGDDDGAAPDGGTKQRWRRLLTVEMAAALEKGEKGAVADELTKKEHPFITYINKTEVNKVMVHIEEVEVNQISMKVLTQPQFLNDDVMDAYIQCLRYKEKEIRGDGKAFLELALKIGLLNVEGAHVEPRRRLPEGDAEEIGTGSLVARRRST